MSTDSNTPASSPIVVHHLNNSRALRVLWLLEELEVPYTIKHYRRDENMLAPKELLEVHPLGKSPIITDGDVTLAETGAIVEYLIMKYDTQGKFAPSAKGWPDNAYYTHFCEGSFMGNSTFSLVMAHMPGQVGALLRPLAKSIATTMRAKVSEPPLKRSLEMIEAHLAKFPEGSNFAGGTNLTSADFMMIFPLETSIKRRREAVGPTTFAWVQRIQSLPSYKAALKKGGEYAFMA